MKNLMYKKLNILEIVLILSPIVDILTSVSQRSFNMSISLGLIIRSFLLFFMTGFMLVKSNYKYKKITIIYLIMIILYSIMFIGNMYFAKGNIYIVSEIKELVKAFYFPICLITILNYIETKDLKIDLKLLFIVLLEYIVLLFLPSIFNIGYDSYVEDKIGTIGWFFSANEISSIYSILIILVVFSYKHIKNITIYIGLLTVSFYTILQIGTKMPAISATIAIIGFIVFYIIKYIHTKNKEYRKYLGVGIGIICIFTFMFITSPVVKNYDIYKNYLISTRQKQEEISKVDDISDNENIKDDKEESEKENDNVNYKSEDLTDDEIATIIHSGRLETMSNVNIEFSKSNAFSKIFGLGRIDTNNSDEFLIEIDYFDILYNYGILGFIIYFVPAIIIAGVIIKNILKNKFKIIFNNDYIFCYIIIILTGFMCAIAGHTLIAPAVSIYITIALIELLRKSKIKGV